MRSVVITVLVLLTVGAHAQDLASCRDIADDAERLACFDALVRDRVTAEPAETPPMAEAEPPAVAPTPTMTDTPPPAPADLGAEAIRDKSGDGKREYESFSATVARCERTDDRRFVFYFSNGQVWKQSKNDRLYLRGCSFDVTITRDFFGYKMQQVGEKKRIRIKRLR